MVAEGTLERAICNFIEHGGYPEDEKIISADLPSATLENLGKLLEQARTDVQASIRELSKLSAPDIDGWIAQAKQLKSDINGSLQQATAIRNLGEVDTKLHEHTTDAAGKVTLLKSEVAFNETLVNTLDLARQLKDKVEETSTAISDGSIENAVSGVGQARRQLVALGDFQTTAVASLFKDNISELHMQLVSRLNEYWEDLLQVDAQKSKITIKQQLHDTSLAIVVAALDELDLLKPKLITFWKALDSIIQGPRLARLDGNTLVLNVEDDSIGLSGPSEGQPIPRLFADIDSIRGYLKTHLPDSVDKALSGIMMPSVISRLVKGPLPASVPPDLDGISAFSRTLAQVSSFVQSLQTSGWHDTDELALWVENAPSVWLQRRSAAALDSMRLLLKRGLGNPRSVEKVETQTVVEGDEMFGAQQPNDDWDAGWDTGWDEHVEDNARGPVAQASQAPAAPATEDEDTGGWGWDEDEADKQANAPAATQTNGDDEDIEAWAAWADDTDKPDSPISLKKPLPSASTKAQASGKRLKHGREEKTMTLRESYCITSLPEQMLELIIMVIEDADTLARSRENPVAPAMDGLYQLSGILLAMHRACAPDAYAIHESGNMFMYNDIQYLAEQLRLFADHHAQRSAENSGLHFDKDIATLELFGKRAYGREMEAQRRILIDLLDGAQGFTNCTQPPYAEQCDLAVESTIDRLRQVHSQWKDVLSPSALLQAIGSLLSTVVNKIIVEIEDMSDISEPESQQLTSYCNSISSLEDLFLPITHQGAESSDAQSVPLTAVYAPSWLKFQYLANILESSLVDIKYLWTEGALSLEYTADEVIDLIEALFADSTHRKNAISDIRRSGRGR